MAESNFQVIKALDNDAFGHLVADATTGRCLGGFGRNFYRCWVFPLYTPAGLTVIQEFAFDHPFHNGFFVGQHPVMFKGQEHNFWVAPPRREMNDPLYVHVGRVDVSGQPEIEISEHGVRFVQQNVWRDENEKPVLDEVRTVRWMAADDATICDVTSEKIAAYGAVEYPQTKLGSIGIRVEPRLLPAFGGVIIADSNRRGGVEIAHEQDSDFVAYENGLSGHNRFGVFMTILDDVARGPWFIRDYGMALYNPTWRQTIPTAAGESWTLGLRVVAYDGVLTTERANQWRRELNL